jgi:hypothetical protein
MGAELCAASHRDMSRRHGRLGPAEQVLRRQTRERVRRVFHAINLERLTYGFANLEVSIRDRMSGHSATTSTECGAVTNLPDTSVHGTPGGWDHAIEPIDGAEHQMAAVLCSSRPSPSCVISRP